jgi:hypothetical protein
LQVDPLIQRNLLDWAKRRNQRTIRSRTTTVRND